MKRDKPQEDAVEEKVERMEVELLGDPAFQLYNLAPHGEPTDLRRPGEVVEADAEFAEQLITNGYAKKVARADA